MSQNSRTPHRQPSLSVIDPIPGTGSRTASSAGITLSGGRYEEVLVHRGELDEAKRENERLRRRVRELEVLVRGRRERSVSTSASVSAASEARERSVSVRGRDQGVREGGGS